MKVLYFDCFAGISGNMILGALFDAGLDEYLFRTELSKLNLKGFEIEIKKTVSIGISGTSFFVKMNEDQHHRGLKDIFNIIDDSDLKVSVKDKSKEIFQRLGEVEAKIHNKDLNQIHFHEVGAVDSIIDIVGFVIALEMLGINKVLSSKVHVGTGTINCAHGILPIPAPATLELLKNVPIYSTGINKELVTPTGAAILTTLSKSYSSLPAFTLENTGFGMGTHKLTIPNFLRVVLGEQAVEPVLDTIKLIETNIDDMNPQYYDHIMELLFEAGAKDVFLNPIIMKKNRPGVILSVLSSPELTDDLSAIILNETTALGVRISELKKRRILRRELKTVNTSFGKVRIKVRELINGEKVVSPEYDDCKQIAKKKKIPIRKVVDTIEKEVGTNLK
ncbi:nickel pincer cofactor biosynthesis protein LarC [Bacteroidota bacterium]